MDKKSRDIFYGTVLVATLIIALVGTTMAYFSYRTGGSDESIKAHSANLNIVYSDGAKVSAQADELIPSSFDVVKKVYEKHIAGGGAPSSGNACIDENNKQVCSVYRFSVKSDIKVDAYAFLNTEYNDFTYLVYAVKDVNNNKWLQLSNNANYLSLAKCSNSNSRSDDDCFTQKNDKKVYNKINSIYGYSNNVLKPQVINSTERVFDLVIFINENNNDQNVDQKKNYQGTISIEATNDIEKVLNG